MWARSETNNRFPLGSSPPVLIQFSTSVLRTHGSMTIPSPRTSEHSCRVIPDGSRWNLRTRSPMTTVCPALFPPWNRATQVACSAKRSTSFPLPSSPHCAPKMTVAGMLFNRNERTNVLELYALTSSFVWGYIGSIEHTFIYCRSIFLLLVVIVCSFVTTETLLYDKPDALNTNV